MKINVTHIIKSTKDLPSLPSVAVEIINLANNADTTIEKVVSLISKDPALSSRILRVVNSPLYVKASPRGVETLKQAIVIMGLNPALNLALSFSLILAFKKSGQSGFDYDLYWQRAVLCGLAARVLGVQVGEMDLEEIFLAALLQDIGMLVLDQIYPDFYAELTDEQFTHEALLKYEHERMFTDHAQLGGLLLDRWKLPVRTCKTVLRSHDPEDVDFKHKVGKFVRCVALSGHFADLLLCQDKIRGYQQLVEKSQAYLSISEAQLLLLIERISDWIPQTEKLFSTKLVSAESAAEILEQAHQTWAQRVSCAK